MDRHEHVSMHMKESTDRLLAAQNMPSLRPLETLWAGRLWQAAGWGRDFPGGRGGAGLEREAGLDGVMMGSLLGTCACREEGTCLTFPDHEAGG